MRDVPAAPALVAVVVIGVVAGAGVSHLDDHAAPLAHTIAVQAGTIAIPHLLPRALHFVAAATAASILGVGVSKSSDVPAGALVWPLVSLAAAWSAIESSRRGIIQ